MAAVEYRLESVLHEL